MALNLKIVRTCNAGRVETAGSYLGKLIDMRTVKKNGTVKIAGTEYRVHADGSWRRLKR